ncbi:hypothetical protein B0H17DRAFT_1134622 [Mycena rosella]|nr:hypothetical protein B0H17DRAFT_1134622 [Mycena rosella]
MAILILYTASRRLTDARRSHLHVLMDFGHGLGLGGGKQMYCSSTPRCNAWLYGAAAPGPIDRSMVLSPHRSDVLDGGRWEWVTLSDMVTECYVMETNTANSLLNMFPRKFTKFTEFTEFTKSVVNLGEFSYIGAAIWERFTTDLQAVTASFNF